MSNLINYNNINQISQINKRNKNNKKKTNGNYFTLYNDKNINHNINYISSENCIKKLFCKSNSFKSQNLNFRKKYTLNNNHLNYKISQKRKKFIKKFSNINDEVKIFENHLKVMRKKSQETILFNVKNIINLIIIYNHQEITQQKLQIINMIKTNEKIFIFFIGIIKIKYYYLIFI